VGSGQCGGGATQQGRTWGAWRGAWAALSAGSDPTPVGAGGQRMHTWPTPNMGGLSHRQVGPGPQ
jgi:hypothetical protein